MQNQYIKQNSNWMVKEAAANFTALNKIVRAECKTIEQKTLATIRLTKLNAKQISAELKLRKAGA